MTPPIPGTWTWSEDDTLKFEVQNDWPVGQKIKIYFEKNLFPSHIHLENYELELVTPTFEYHVVEQKFYQNPQKAREKKVITELSFTHPVEPKSLEKNVALTFQDMLPRRCEYKTPQKESPKHPF